jgi:hypothetical protein
MRTTASQPYYLPVISMKPLSQLLHQELRAVLRGVDDPNLSEKQLRNRTYRGDSCTFVPVTEATPHNSLVSSTGRDRPRKMAITIGLSPDDRKPEILFSTT